MGRASELRITRALRDNAAYRIAEAVADGRRPFSDDVNDFKMYRLAHSRMLLQIVYRRKRDKDGKTKAL